MPSVCKGEECRSVSVIGCSWLFLAGAALPLSDSGGLPGSEGLGKKIKEREQARGLHAGQAPGAWCR